VLRGKIACARGAQHAIRLRRCAAARLVTTVGEQDLFDHREGPIRGNTRPRSASKYAQGSPAPANPDRCGPNPTGPRDPMRRSIREDPGAVRTAPVAASQAA